MEYIDLIESISDLLYKKNCVIIPNFGGFITNYVPSGIEEGRSLISPPSKKIAFNQSLIENDGILISHWARIKNISYQDSLEKVNSFSLFLKNKIDLNKSFDFKNIGTFYLNSEGKMLFVPYQGLNFLESSFGLFPLKIKSIHQNSVNLIKARTASSQINTVQAEENKFIKETNKIELKSNLSNRNWLKVASVAFILGLSVFSLLYYNQLGTNKSVKVKKSNSNNEAGFLTLNSEVKKEKVAKINLPIALDFSVERTKIDDLKEKLKALENSNRKKHESFNVLIGYFSTQINAKNILTKVNLEYPEAKLAEHNSSGYGIIVENFYDHNSAKKFSVILKQNGFKNILIEKQVVFGY